MRSPNPALGLTVEDWADYRWPPIFVPTALGRKHLTFSPGRGPGGTSLINSMIALRGLPGDFQRWHALGCVGWGWNDILPTFIRLETDQNFGHKPYHGDLGPLPISRVPHQQWGAVSAAMYNSCLRLGYRPIDDLNAPNAVGLSACPLNVEDDERVSSYDAYIDPLIDERTNLILQANTVATRILFRGQSAIGIEVSRPNASRQQIEAEEVVLCAGVIGSPVLLLRSGIGAKDALIQLGIDPVQNLPAVGQNLTDHPTVTLSLEVLPDAQVSSIDSHMVNCSMRYTSRHKRAGKGDMLVFAGNVIGYGPEAKKQATISVYASHVFSHRGSVSLNPKDPQAHPILTFATLSDDRDVARLCEGAQMIVGLVSETPFQNVASPLTTGSAHLLTEAAGSDVSMENVVRRVAHPAYHAVGTCRMGPAGDENSVVDSDCRVQGVQRLRVADASVMPDIPSANTHLTCVMIGEHLAQHMLTSQPH
jgi:choline dehydrogenase